MYYVSLPELTRDPSSLHPTRSCLDCRSVRGKRVLRELPFSPSKRATALAWLVFTRDVSSVALQPPTDGPSRCDRPSRIACTHSIESRSLLSPPSSSELLRVLSKILLKFPALISLLLPPSRRVAPPPPTDGRTSSSRGNVAKTRTAAARANTRSVARTGGRRTRPAAPCALLFVEHSCAHLHEIRFLVAEHFKSYLRFQRYGGLDRKKDH